MIDLKATIMKARREHLLHALRGSPRDRFDYAIHRATHKAAIDLSIYGTSVSNPTRQASMAAHWFLRLTHIAKRMS
jgi:hypothetical protein